MEFLSHLAHLMSQFCLHLNHLHQKQDINDADDDDEIKNYFAVDACVVCNTMCITLKYDDSNITHISAIGCFKLFEK